MDLNIHNAIGRIKRRRVTNGSGTKVLTVFTITSYYTKRRRRCTATHRAYGPFWDLSLLLVLIVIITSPLPYHGFQISPTTKLANIPTWRKRPVRRRQLSTVPSSVLNRYTSKPFTTTYPRLLALNNKENDGDNKSKDHEEVLDDSTESVNSNANATTTSNDAFIKSIRKTLQKIDPFGAGYQFRRTLDSAISTLAGGPSPSSAALNLYYLEDRLFALESSSVSGKRPYDPQTVPEVLVVGATTEIGKMIVRKLILRGIRVRVLVPNLYSSTLDLFGTKVVYCVGDILDIESLEYAVTDVDKIMFCLSSSEEEDEDGDNTNNKGGGTDKKKYSPYDIYVTGMNNLLHAYQNVRFADYGAGQAAKRLLFKFKRLEDFGLFDIEREEQKQQQQVLEGSWIAATADEGGREKSVVRNNQWSCWERNKFNNTSFYGRINSSADGQVAILSTRLRARRKTASTNENKSDTMSKPSEESEEEESEGIDLSRGFSGFIVRLCGDGQQYECFIRTKAYDLLGIEYVYAFSTLAKSNGTETILNKFQTLRMPFAEFKPIYQRRSEETEEEDDQQILQSLPKFTGKDVRHIGFRYRSKSNKSGKKNVSGSGTIIMPNFSGRSRTQGFYLALSYIKLYRSNIEPELVFLSDSRIPPWVRNELVRHDKKQFILNTAAITSEEDAGYTLFTGDNLNNPILSAETDKGHEATYYKYLGEQLLRQSGLR